MLDIFSFFWFPGGSPPKGPKLGEGGHPYFFEFGDLSDDDVDW